MRIPPEQQPLWKAPPGAAPPFWVDYFSRAERWREDLSAAQIAQVETRLSDSVIEAMAALLPGFRSPEHRTAFRHLLCHVAASALTYSPLGQPAGLASSQAAVRQVVRAARSLRGRLEQLDDAATLLIAERLEEPMPERATRELLGRLIGDLATLMEVGRDRPGTRSRKGTLRGLIDSLADLYEYVTGQRPAQTRGTGSSSSQQGGAFAQLVRAVTDQLPEPFRGPSDASIRAVLERRAKAVKDGIPPPKTA